MFPRRRDNLRELTEKFCTARSPSTRVRRATELFRSMWTLSGDRRSVVQMLRWIRVLEQDQALNASFTEAWNEMLEGFDFVPLFAETGLPSHHGLPVEVVRRIFERLLPSARDESDMARFLAGIFDSSAAVGRFLQQDAFAFARLATVLVPQQSEVWTRRMQRDLRQALRLLAARVVGRGTSPAIRARGSTPTVEESPFYLLLFATERLLDGKTSMQQRSEFTAWQAAVQACHAELEQVHVHMEDAGVSSALVYDLRSIERTLRRMQVLVAVAADDLRAPYAAERAFFETLLRGLRNDVKLRALMRENLTLLAQKTVERTGHGGEHYIAHTRRDYWVMWRAGAGGGILTVFTAAIKMRLIESHFPLAIEGFLIGTDYAVSFVLLQIFGFALATKQPSMTAATLAGIIRKNRGVARLSRISEFAADIVRTQLAAALSNVIAVCLGAVVFEGVWAHFFKDHYLPKQSAQHVYQTLHPFTSGTAIFAAFTGVLLWMAAVIGAWFENFIVYHRVTEAISQHPAGVRLGARTMRRAADWLEVNAGSWSTSIVLGYLLGFAPVVARFFGVPLDVRHVTLSTGTLALAAARFGTESLGQGWFYFAVAGAGGDVCDEPRCQLRDRVGDRAARL